MPSPTFPAAATLLDAKRCPLDKFDALFTKITQERRIRDGYFRHDHPGETWLLFVVNGSPYGAGRVAGEACAFQEVHEFFTAYAQRPDSPLSFFVADKRLLLGLMVLFQHQPTLSFKTDRVDIVDLLDALSERGIDQILALRVGDACGISLAAKGRPAVNFLVPHDDVPGSRREPAEQLVKFARGHADGVSVDVYETTRVEPAGDVVLVTPETRGRLVEVFRRVAARIREEATEAPLELEAPPDRPVAAEIDDHPFLPPPEELGLEGPPVPGIELGAPPVEEWPEAERPAEPAEGPTGEPAVVEAAPADPAPPGREVPLEPLLDLDMTGQALPRLDEDVSFFELEAPPDRPVAAEIDDHPFLPPPEELGLEGPPVPGIELGAPPVEEWPEAERPAEPAEGPTGEPAVVEAAPADPAPPAGPAPELLLFVGDKQLGTFSLVAGEATIGRTPNNTIIIDNAGVSRRHAVIRLAGDKATLQDLGSANGTFVRGQRIQEYELQDGDEIVIVKHRLVYRIPKEADAFVRTEAMDEVGQRTMYIDAGSIAQAMGSRPGNRPDGLASTLRPRLILPDLKKFALDLDEVNLGTAIGCQIQLSGMFVGKVHAKIVRTKEGQFKLQHLAGLAATRVNGEKISEHLLKHGDEIEIGKQKLLFRLER